eukprot:Colp12_sorted_trinity150504_noHs@602
MSERERSRSPAKQRSPSPAPASKAEETSDSVFGLNIHVNNLARSVTDEMLRDLFGKYGKILEATVVVDPHTKESRGFGFVRIESIPDGEAAIEALNGTQLEGRDLGVQRVSLDVKLLGQLLGPLPFTDCLFLLASIRRVFSWVFAFLSSGNLDCSA